MATILNVCVALIDGVPLSVTITVNTFVEPDGPKTVQSKTPLFGLIVAPAGAPAPKLKSNVFVGKSESVAGAVKVTVWPMKFVRLAIGDSTGAVFTSVTITWKLLVALKLGEPLSKTRTVTVFVLGPCASVGVQAMAPLAETVKPVGPDTKAKLSVLAGTS